MNETKQAVEVGTAEVAASAIASTTKGKKLTLTMNVQYDDIEAILTSKLAPSPSLGDPPITSNTLLYNLCLAQTKYDKSEERRLQAKEERQLLANALSDAQKCLRYCICDQGRQSGSGAGLCPPIARLSRRASHTVLQSEARQNPARLY